jgi:hypothetical protein
MFGKNNQTTNQNDNQYSEHTEHMFCSDMTCPCKEDRELIGKLNQQIQDGEASVDDANRIYRGKTV